MFFIIHDTNNNKKIYIDNMFISNNTLQIGYNVQFNNLLQ